MERGRLHNRGCGALALYLEGAADAHTLELEYVTRHHVHEAAGLRQLGRWDVDDAIGGDHHQHGGRLFQRDLAWLANLPDHQRRVGAQGAWDEADEDVEALGRIRGI